MKNRLAAILTGGILTLTTGILPSYALTTTSVDSNNLQQETSLIKDYSNILISQASVGNRLSPGKATQFTATKKNINKNNRSWKFCFNSASDRKQVKIKVSAVGSRKYKTHSANGQRCFKFPATNTKWKITNISRNTVEYSLSPE